MGPSGTNMGPVGCSMGPVNVQWAIRTNVEHVCCEEYGACRDQYRAYRDG